MKEAATLASSASARKRLSSVWSFSWSELCIDYLAGMTIGLCFYFGTERKTHEAAQFFLVFSNGLFGLLHVCGVALIVARTAHEGRVRALAVCALND